jgi:Ca2+-binding EF-hand superfamily protein
LIQPFQTIVIETQPQHQSGQYLNSNRYSSTLIRSRRLSERIVVVATTMGNTPINANARNTVSPLAITAVSRRLKLKKTKVIYLREVLNSLADDDDDCIKYDHFKEGLKQAKFLKPREVDVFDLLFTMWDHDGKGKISFKNLVVGIAPLACPEEDLGKVLQFAMIISDEDKRGTIGRDELENVMYSKLHTWSEIRL